MSNPATAFAIGLEPIGSRRHEWLDHYILGTIEKVQQIATEWLWTCNNERPTMGIGGVAPAMKLKMPA